MTSPWPAGVRVREREPMSRHVAWRCGGPCDAFVVVHRPEALGPALAGIRERGWRWRVLGAGTRTAVRAGGLPGAVLRLGIGFCGIERDAGTWRVGAAMPVPALVALAAASGAHGVEDLGGTAGSVGAAVALDDGPWMGRVSQVTYWSGGRERTGSLAELRAALGPKRPGIVLAVDLRLDLGDPRVVAASTDRMVCQAPSPWFSTTGDDAAALVRRAGLDGARVRSVRVPPSAPAMLVAARADQAEDLELFARSIADRVRARTGAEIATRVRWEGRGSRGIPDGVGA